MSTRAIARGGDRKIHEVSNPLFFRYRQSSSLTKAVYRPKPFFLHAASLDQAFAHCRMFLTAATRRCMTRISVSSLRNALSRPLPVIALVGRYPSNKLIGPRFLLKRLSPFKMLRIGALLLFLGCIIDF